MIGKSLFGGSPPPKQPSLLPEIVPPGQSIGSDQSGFKKSFMDFMADAGAALGKAARDEIEKSRIAIEWGGGARASGGNQWSSWSQRRYYGGSRNTLQSQNVSDLFARSRNLASSIFEAAKARGLGLASAGRAGAAAGAAGFLAGLPVALYGMGVQQESSQRQYARVSAPIAQNYAQSDVRRMQREMRIGAGIAETNQALLRSLDNLRSELVPFQVAMARNLNYLVAAPLEKLDGVIEWVKKRFGIEDGKPPDAVPFVQRFRDLADAADANKNLGKPVPRAIQPLGPIGPIPWGRLKP